MKIGFQKMIVSLIAALANNHVIGKNNQLPWYLPADLKYFKQITLGKPIIMGRKTYESMGKPLPGRHNIVVTRDPNYQLSHCTVVNSLDAAITAGDSSEEIIIIGGAEIYQQALAVVDRMYITYVNTDIDGDTFFPKWDTTAWHEVSREDFSPNGNNKYNYSFCTFERNTAKH